MSKQKWWRFTVRPVSSAPCAFTVLMAAITLSLYIIFGTRRCDTQEFKKGKHPDSESYNVPYPYKYHFTLDQPEKCQHNPFLVIIIPAAPNDVMERNAIRNTWGQENLVQEKHVVVLFLLGLPSGRNAEIQQARIHQENLRHRDLLQSNFVDSRKNVTIKTMVMLEWLRDRCPQAYYAAKVDSDILFNVRALISMLLSPGIPQRNYLTGQVRHDSSAIRNPSSRFYIPPEVYSTSLHPAYPLGKCYIMSTDLPAKILKASRKIKPILKDDLYIGLCLEWLHIAPTDPPNPERFVFTPPELYNRCYYSDLIAVIIYTPAQLVSLWTDIHKPGPPCSSFD
ncbi:beta-1,3-galactosyltransferase 2-like isoform X2 [Pangasianodon hypophthalmus]|uniref:beta-1,3-galactosyltransferase 2-like isoform X2 n=1 Tax=Pangasianodon hypophthalmus TaxID=310915 RepID=UPI000EFEFD12|nr:beta-1,3-galactosyltransferase 2-like isoform X2 [Pangasianodon hypophthalmus]